MELIELYRYDIIKQWEKNLRNSPGKIGLHLNRI